MVLFTVDLVLICYCELDFLQGAFWGMVIGHICGVIRLVLDLAYPAPECGHEDTRPSILVNLHYTYFGALMIVITSIAIVIISLLTKPPTEETVSVYMCTLNTSL